jgi:rubrerythrin
VTDAATSRRQALRGAAIGAGAIAAGGLLRPGAAAAQAPSDEDLRDFLAEAIALEQITVLAYARAADSEGVDPQLRGMLQTFRDQEQAHANALRTAIDSLGFDAPSAPDDTDETTVFEDVDGIDEDTAAQLTRLLERIETLEKPGDWLAYLVDLESRQIAYYVENAPGLDSEDLATTSAEIAGCQAQHLQVLSVERGNGAAVAVGEAVKAATGAPAPADAGE